MCYHQINKLFLIMFSMTYMELAYGMRAGCCANEIDMSVSHCFSSTYYKINWHIRMCQFMCQFGRPGRYCSVIYHNILTAKHLSPAAAQKLT